jgi:hypothetical protein
MATTRQPTSRLVTPNPGEQHQQRTHTCLGCGGFFASTHAGHRICRRCKALDA